MALGSAEGTAAVGGDAATALLSIDTTLSSSLSQLKRLQRDFKGLPPASMIAESVSSETNKESTGESSVTKSVTGGTKKTFSDEE